MEEKLFAIDMQVRKYHIILIGVKTDSFTAQEKNTCASTPISRGFYARGSKQTDIVAHSIQY